MTSAQGEGEGRPSGTPCTGGGGGVRAMRTSATSPKIGWKTPKTASKSVENSENSVIFGINAHFTDLSAIADTSAGLLTILLKSMGDNRYRYCL